MCEVSYSDELLKIAAKVKWFENPEITLKSSDDFLAHLMVYGSIDNILVVKKYYSDLDFKNALQNSSPGLFGKKSWAYWNCVYNNLVIPKMPERIV